MQLYWPYGNGEYSWGTMPTTYTFTGQRLDSVTGLLYDNFYHSNLLIGQILFAHSHNPGG